jgi:hypothetical protein
MVDHYRLTRVEEYVRAGRQYRTEETEQLKKLWRAAFQLWATDPSAAAPFVPIMEDLEAELGLRGERLPDDEQVAAATEKMRANVAALKKELEADPERMAALTRAVGNEYRAFVATMKKGRAKAN